MNRNFDAMQLRSSTVAFALILLLSAGSASAAGFGAYIQYGYASGELKLSDFGTGILDEIGVDGDDLVDVDFTKDTFGVGLMLDTNVARDDLFNYRLTIGYEATDRDHDSGKDPLDATDRDADGVAIDQTFGFGFYRRPTVRVWAGPIIRLSADFYDTPGDVDQTDIGIGGGPQLGVNWHFADRYSLSTSVGYQYSYIAELVDGKGEDETLDGSEHRVSVTVAILFRTASDLFE